MDPQVPLNTPLTPSQLISLIRTVEGLHQEEYIRLDYSLPQTHPQFHPYRLQIKNSQVPSNKGHAHSSHYTLSKSGILHMSPGSVEFISISQFLEEMGLYETIRRIPFFDKYRLWKGFAMWRAKTIGRKLSLVRESLMNVMLFNTRPLGMVLEELSKLCEGMRQLSFLKIDGQLTYSLDEFLKSQILHEGKTLAKFKTFEKILIEMTTEVCRAVFVDNGFTPDSYQEEVEYVKGLSRQNRLVTRLDYPGQWLPYSEQARKRHVCKRLANFLRLVDYYVQQTYSQILKNSVVSLLLELNGRVEGIIDKEHSSVLEHFIEEHEKCAGHLTHSMSTKPLFFVKCSWRDNEHLIFSPSASDIISGFHSLLNGWAKSVLSYENICTRPIFYAYTRPIINGHLEATPCGDGPNMELLIINDSTFSETSQLIQTIAHYGIEVCSNYLQTFDHIRKLCLENEKNEKVELTSYEGETDPTVFSKLLHKFQEQAELLERVEDTKDLGVFRIDNSILKEQAGPTISHCLDALKKRIQEVLAVKVTSTKERISSSIDILTRSPTTAVEYLEYITQLGCIPEEMRSIEVELTACTNFLDMMLEHSIQPYDSAQLKFQEIDPIVLTLRETVHERLNEKQKLTEELIQAFHSESDEMVRRIAEIEVIVRGEDILNSASDPGRNGSLTEKLKGAMDELTGLKEKADWLELNGKQFKLEMGKKFGDLDKLVEFTKIRHQLWNAMDSFSEKQVGEWEVSSIENIKQEELKEDIGKYLNIIEQLEQLLPPNELLPLFKTKVEYLRMQLPWVECLQNPSLTERHWAELNNLVGVDLSEKSLTFKHLLNLGITNYIDLFKEINSQAYSESELETSLKKVKESWTSVKFNVLPYQNQRDMYILGDTENIQILLDDCQVRLSTISSSIHAAPIKHKIDELTNLLETFDQTLEEWENCQRRWIQLEPIFSRPNIKPQLPNEFILFAQVNKGWKEIMSKTIRSPSALHAGASIGALEALQQNNQLIDQIMKGLEDFLNSKRMKFPRFYFLSNEDLLEILSQDRDPRAAEPYLNKLFNAIEKLQFGREVSPSGLEILAMYSAQGERVSLPPTLRAKGNAELWLRKLEEGMFSALKRKMADALKGYQTLKKEEWFQKYPSQVLLTASQVIWTQAVHQILDGPPRKMMIDLRILKDDCAEKLNNLGAMVRGPLSPIMRTIISSLITITVHSKQVVDNMLDAKVKSVDCFEWRRHLRYYLDPMKELVSARMVTGNYSYGYEYLGIFSKLVITPLTERAFLSLMLALQLNVGGALAGPSATGKSETIKDFARSLANFCISLNCSQGLDCEIVGRILSGLVQSGGWICLDHFDKLPVEVMSFTAQQLQTIRLAKMSKLPMFIFEGKEIKLVETCSVFITMNHCGGTGGGKLPPNLVTLFRPVNLIIPDYDVVAEVILFSEGFEEYKTLAKKVTQMFKFCWDLEPQKDYDLRALKEVLNSSGKLKRENPNVIEDSLMVRTLMKSNLSRMPDKYIATFVDIIKDFFPTVEVSMSVEHDTTNDALKQAAESWALKKGLQISDGFIRKVLQLHDMMASHNGVMLVGHAGVGKTTVYEVLKGAMQSYSLQRRTEEGVKHLTPVEVITTVQNPKVLSFGELYGELDPITRKWRDGILSRTLSKVEQSRDDIQHWIIFDGPVDPLWTDNLNSVLDDNNVLCLPNLERIKLPPWVYILFEVDDLAQASPATISRCGIVYMDENDLGWRPIFRSWLTRNVMNKEVEERLKTLIDKYFDDGLQFTKQHCKEVIPQTVTGKVSTLCALLEALLLKCSLDYSFQQVCQIFLFTYVWSLGGNIDEADCSKFDNFVRQQFKVEEGLNFLEVGANVSEIYPNLENNSMEKWDTMVPHYVHNFEMSFEDILVPTLDTVRFGYLLELLLTVSKAVLFTGKRCIGKSTIARHVLNSISSPEGNYLPHHILFSYGTCRKTTQKLIEDNLEEKQRSVMSAPLGKKLIVMIDDLNMPKRDEYGGQPALELIRQLVDQNGFHDIDKLFWKRVEDVVIAGSCSPTGSRNSLLSPRLVRHFSILAIPSPSKASLRKIYSSILREFISEFVTDAEELTEPLISALISTYDYTRSRFLPTPSKFHYLFNMRDLSRFTKGVSQVSKDSFMETASMARLICHELQRVFHDRLVTDEERQDFNTNLAKISSQTLKEDMTAAELSTLIFGDFMEMERLKEDRTYEEIPDMSKLTSVLTNYLEDYNAENRWRQMNLVFFPQFARQVARLARLFRMNNSHALLLGVGGIGKRILARVAAYICGLKWFQIEQLKGYEIRAFRGKLKRLHEVAGIKNQPLVLYLAESQLAREDFLQDINSILVSREVPQLLGHNEIEMTMKSLVEGADGYQLNDLFTRRVKRNLRLVLGISPVGNGFREKFRKYPSLLSCCSVNVVSEWKEEALLFVANSFIGNPIVNLGKNNVSAETLSQMFVLVHTSSEEMADKFSREMKRCCYATPSSYLEMIHLYSSLLKGEREKIASGKARIQNGLLKVLETEELVKQMRIELKELEPLLIQKSQAVEDLMLVLSEDLAGADIVRRNVHVEESTAKEKAGETQAIAEDAQKDLAEALPALEAAVKSLDSLEKSDIVELKLFQKPPELVRTVMEAVCILFELKPDWTTAKVLVTDAQFLKKLYDFDKDNVSESTIKKLKVYIDNPNFTPKKIEKVSKACKSICMWVRAIDLYAKVFKTVEPKRSRYLTSQSDLDKVMDTLKSKQEQLNDVERRITSLQQRYEGSMKEKQDLVDNMELTAARLRRAARLTMALSSEQTKWAEAVEKFAERMKNLVGDVFVAAACIAYFGAFTSEYRRQLILDWVKNCVESGIPVTPGFSLGTFADPFEVRVWYSFGLPKDPTSIENGVLVTSSKRWPLMIDPHGYANQWIRELESSRHLKVLTFYDRNFIAIFQKCIRLGTPCLIEDVKETLNEHSILEAVLLRQVCTKNGKSLIRLGGKELQYGHNFRLYLTTTLENPQFATGLWSKMTIINFMVTKPCLEDQLLSDVVRLERPDLESQRQALVAQLSSDKNELISQENKVLGMLFHSEGNILDDELLINALNDFKETSNVASRRVAEIEAMEGGIHKAREKYRSVAVRATAMFFVTSKLSELDPMYQFSLKYFRQLFINCISSSEPTEELSERLNFLQSEVTKAIYTNVSRGLFEKDKLTFSFLLCSQILRSKKVIKEEEWAFFLQGREKCEGGHGSEQFPQNLALPDQELWRDLCHLERISDAFKGLREAAVETTVKINIGTRLNITLFDHPNPTTSQSDKWNKKLTSFQKFLLIKSKYPERLKEAATEFVVHELGQPFVESPLPKLSEIQMELNKFTPMIFLLSGGSNPNDEFYRFASDQSHRVSSVALGNGQVKEAERVIRGAVTTGDWVFLQNCHLVPSWFPTLEQVVKSLGKRKASINDNFRMFLSSTSTPTFLPSILQDSIKVTIEPAKGLRGSVRQVLSQLEADHFEHNILGSDWRKMVFALCVFHGVIQERKQFGWAVNYEFTDGDRNSALKIMEIFCRDGRPIPWEALEYTTGQIIYGGRILQQWEQRCLRTILKTYFSPGTTNHVFFPSEIYYAPGHNSIGAYLEYVDGLPATDELAIYGMDENATLCLQQKRSSIFLETLRALQPYHQGGRISKVTSSQDEIVLSLAENLESKLPPNLDQGETRAHHFRLDESGRIPPLTAFMQQEIGRFNKLLDTIRDSLAQLRHAMTGLTLMSEELDKLYDAILNRRMPECWAKISYISLKAMTSWFNDLVWKVHFIKTWQTGSGSPSSFPLSAFFSPQSFLMAVLQSHARKHELPIEELRYQYKVFPVVKTEQLQFDKSNGNNSIQIPEDGILVHGLFLEAASWDIEEMKLVETFPNELCPVFPIIHFLPSLMPQPTEPDPHAYTCPLYRTSTLNYILPEDTAKLRNFITAIPLSSNQPEDYWITRGTSLLTQLSDCK